ncbi:MAG: hypothetical protein FJX59_11975, partial [Alphaproteobacteria bacterium]|nr:hypothetical protein [Alphaproteobacteria bacterium]
MIDKRAVLGSVAALAAIGAGDVAVAQTLAIEEIVVTSRKREENLQQVPLSIAAFSADSMKDLDIRGAYELQNHTPNFSFDKSFGRRFDRPIIRGQSSVQATDVLASFFVDGVYISGSISTVSTDALERIEVLRGPQSALYGRGAFGGAINYVTKQPSDEFEGQINTRLGSHADYKAAVWMRGPIVEGRLQYFISGNWEDYGGQWRNQFQGHSGRSVGPENNLVRVPTGPDYSRLGSESVKDTTAKLRFLPSDNLEFNLKASYASSADAQFASVYIPASMNNCFRPGIDPGVPNTARGYFCGEVKVGNLRPNLNLPALREGVVIQAVDNLVTSPNFGRVLRYDPVALNNFLNNLTNLSVPQPAPLAFTSPAFATGVPLNIASAGAKPGQYRDVGIYVADIQYDYNDWNLLAQATYNTDKAVYNIDADRFPLLNPASSTTRVIETSGGSQTYEISYDYSFEGRITSPADQRLRGMAGVYYYDREGKGRGRTLGGNVVRSTFFFDDGSDFSRNFITYKAVYGQAQYEINQQFTVSVEARYGQDERSIPFNATTTRPVKSSLKSFTPRVSVDYQYNDDTLFYASFAEGALPGGFNVGVFSRTATGPTDAEFARLESEGKTTFGPEQNNVYEAGVKSTVMDDRLQLNATLFYIDWKKQKINQAEQFITPNGIGGASIQINSGSSRVQGIELSTSFLASENLTLSFNYGMADHVFKAANDLQIEIFEGIPQDRTLANGGNAKGKHSILAPKHSGSAGAAWRDALTADADWFARADLSYQSRKFGEIHNIAWTGAYFRLNTRIGVQTDRWRLDAYVNNVLDDLTPGAIFRGADSSI